MDETFYTKKTIQNMFKLHIDNYIFFLKKFHWNNFYKKYYSL